MRKDDDNDNDDDDKSNNDSNGNTESHKRTHVPICQYGNCNTHRFLVYSEVLRFL